MTEGFAEELLVQLSHVGIIEALAELPIPVGAVVDPTTAMTKVSFPF